MVRSRPVRKDTPYEQFKKIPGVCMLCGRPVDAHWRPCWKVEPVETTGTTSRVEEAKQRSRQILDGD